MTDNYEYYSLIGQNDGNMIHLIDQSDLQVKEVKYHVARFEEMCTVR